MKNSIYLLLLISLLSCNTTKEEFSYIDLSKSIILDSAETVITFDDKYPTDIKILDSLLYIIQTKSDSCMMVVNLNTKKKIRSFGRVGHGPDDLMSPNFIHSIGNPDIIIEEGKLRKILKIKHSKDSTEFVEYSKYPEAIFPSSELNFSTNFIVGRKVDASEDKMFFIYNKNTGSLTETGYYPELGNVVADPNYTFASALAFNEYKNRIVAGMYFFDMFHLYDLEGKRIHTFCFSKKWLPTVDEKNKRVDLNNGYSGIIRVFPTENYCYLFRYTQLPENGNSEKTIVQINWEGELINSYTFTDDISGQFYMDEKLKKLYAIRNYINTEGNEIFGIVAYKIP